MNTFYFITVGISAVLSIWWFILRIKNNLGVDGYEIIILLLFPWLPGMNIVYSILTAQEIFDDINVHPLKQIHEGLLKTRLKKPE